MNYTDEQLIITQGVFSKQIEFIELYRVKDFTIYKPFLLRLMRGLHLRIFTSDKSSPAMVLRGVPDDDTPYKLRDLVENNRVEKEVFEID